LSDTLVLRDRDPNGSGTLSERLYAQQDANGNVTALVDTSGNVVERYLYDPFGGSGVSDPAPTILDANWNELAGSSYAWRYLFQGLRYDATTGLYYSRNRDYSPTLGRFLEHDPLGFDAGDTNLYRYVGNDPINADDPFGKDAITAAGAAMAKGGALGPDAETVNAFILACYQSGQRKIAARDRRVLLANQGEALDAYIAWFNKLCPENQKIVKYALERDKKLPGANELVAACNDKPFAPPAPRYVVKPVKITYLLDAPGMRGDEDIVDTKTNLVVDVYVRKVKVYRQMGIVSEEDVVEVVPTNRYYQAERPAARWW
jgi:RHS repeat-associated protein